MLVPALAAALLAPAVAVAKPASCIDKVFEFNQQRNQKRWARFVHGLQNNFARGMITDATNDALVAKQAFSCRLVALALDRLMTGAVQDPSTVFTSGAFNTAVDTAVTNTQPTVFHFKIPADVKISKGSDENLGHHWVIEINFEGTNAGAHIYMAFEDQYKLKSWLKNKYQPQGALGAGRRRLTIAELKEWGRQLENLIAKLKLAADTTTGAAMRKQASTAAGNLYRTLFGVSWEDMEMAPDHLIGADPANVKALFARANYNPQGCDTLIQQLLQQAQRTCNNDLCS
jgi:hypothetical protein